MSSIYHAIRKLLQIAILAFVVLMITPYTTLKSYLVTQMDRLLCYSGLEIKTIEITGVKESDITTNDVQSSLYNNILFINKQKLKRVLKENVWIENLTIGQILPNSLIITVEEKEPMVTMANNILDKYGQIITSDSQQKYNHLVAIQGLNAEQHIVALFEDIDIIYPQLKDILTEATYIGNRRWNLRTDTNQIITLPEENVQKALAALKEIHITTDDLKMINLQNSKHIFVRSK